MGFFSKDKAANIHETSWDGKKNVSPDFKGVPNANNALTHVLAAEGSIVLEEGTNDDEGRQVLVLKKIGNTKLWGETEYEVKKGDGSIPD